MNIFCSIFGHRAGPIKFTVFGTYEIPCVRCHDTAKGIVPEPHVHEFSRPFTLHPAANTPHGITHNYVKRCMLDGCDHYENVKRRPRKVGGGVAP